MRPCTCDKETCRPCWLYHNHEGYRGLWAGHGAAGPRCVHLGAETGDRRRCPSCTGHVEVKLLGCAVHGACTTGKAVPGVACCAGCPDRAAYPPVRTRHLLYHLYPVRGNGAWQANVDELRKRLPLFNGRRVVAVAVDPPGGRAADPAGPGAPDGRRHLAPAAGPDEVRARFGRHAAGVEFVVAGNDPALREVATFETLFSRVADPDPHAATLYAQAKGTTRPPGDPAHEWARVLYETCCDYWPLVAEHLRQFPVTGPFKKVGRGWPAHQSGSEFHFSGSWCWYRNDALFARDWRKIDRFWSGIESYASLHFREDEAGCLFHGGPVGAVNLYGADYWRTTVRPALQRWRAENARHRHDPRRRPLLPDGAWEHVFGPLRGRRVGYVPLPGNAGDRLIEAGTFALLARSGVDWSVGADPDADVLLVAGGGSMGFPEYALCREARLKALAAGPPVWVLPQSWRGRDPEADAGRYARLFARDRPSLAHAPAGTELAPDLALALDRLPDTPPAGGPGTWLRRDCEALFADVPSLGDPVEGCRDGWHYLERAGRHAAVTTDRLHFAIAALLCGREATLLPNAYHKNRGCWEASLADLGCRWADRPGGVA